jgi:hypothetical protein
LARRGIALPAPAPREIKLHVWRVSSSSHSPAEVVKIERNIIAGEPDKCLITTAHVEKQNHTLQMRCRRLTRLTNEFSKKLDNFKAAVALNFAYYSFCKVHGAIRCTPAMAQCGVRDKRMGFTSRPH